MLHIPRALRSLAAAIAAAATLAAPALAEQKRLALILANEDYPSSIGRLTQAHNDAAVVETALRQVGFAVTKRLDQNSSGMQTALADFLAAVDAEAADGDDVVVFFYAAMHGVVADTIEGQRNFLVPAREQIGSPVDLLNRGVRVDAVINGLAMTKAKAVIVVSDACRNSNTAFSRSGVRGFVPVTAGANMMIAYATEAGATTPDDGVFARVLAREIVAGGRKANYAMADVVGNVGRERAVNSRPYTTGSLPDWLCFNGCSAAASSSRPTVIPPAPFDLAQLHPRVREAVQQARSAQRRAEETADKARQAAVAGEDAARKARAGQAGYRTGSNSSDSWAAQWSDNAKNGYGVADATAPRIVGHRYAGQWSNDRRSGVGVSSFALNEENVHRVLRYEGEHVSGKRQGFGVFLWRDGSRYAGGFSDGNKDGHGVYNLPDGKRYEGEFREEARHGNGVLWSADGRVLQAGLWNNSSLARALR